jgi:hypothetical protein
MYRKSCQPRISISQCMSHDWIADMVDPSQGPISIELNSYYLVNEERYLAPGASVLSCLVINVANRTVTWRNCESSTPSTVEGRGQEGRDNLHSRPAVLPSPHLRIMRTATLIETFASYRADKVIFIRPLNSSFKTHEGLRQAWECLLWMVSVTMLHNEQRKTR